MCHPFSPALLTWYQQNARDLPWRSRPDSGVEIQAYAVWVSEIMLQQTRVETVIPYFTRWMEQFPNIPSLAEATQQAALFAWEGLGYYSRARNLHHAAQIVVRDYHGQLPKDLSALGKLPGIGRYTAGAITSIAFGMDEAALDGNIRRVLARLFNVTEPARSPAGEKRLWDLAKANLPSGRAADYNQALMDLGAVICTPRSPNCPACPVAEMCAAKTLGLQESRPVVLARQPTPHFTVTAGVIQRQNEVLITQRPPSGLLGGLWEFPGGKLIPGEELQDCLKREICEELGVDIDIQTSMGTYRHAYTHFRVTLHAFSCRLVDGAQPRALQATDLRWVKPTELVGYPMGKIDRQIALHVMEKYQC